MPVLNEAMTNTYFEYVCTLRSPYTWDHARRRVVYTVVYWVENVMGW